MTKAPSKKIAQCLKKAPTALTPERRRELAETERTMLGWRVVINQTGSWLRHCNNEGLRQLGIFES